MPRQKESDLFRRNLADLAAAGDWAQWDQARLIFADWLEERGEFAEVPALRARWMSHQGVGPCQMWYVTLESQKGYPVKIRGDLNRRMKMASTAKPFLHFAPRTLFFHGYGQLTVSYRFWHWPNYEPWKHYETGKRMSHPLAERVLPGGFCALFGYVPDATRRQVTLF